MRRTRWLLAVCTVLAASVVMLVLTPANGQILSGAPVAPSTIVPQGPYMIAGGDRNIVWRVDQKTGLVSYCIRDIISTDPAFIAQRPPYCSAWSK